MRVLLSINPCHVARIVDGSKRYEFRRKTFRRLDVKTVLIYCTKPVGLLVGEFDIVQIIQNDPESLWRHTSHASGISKSFFDDYFDGRQVAFALQIGEVRPFKEPISPYDVFEAFYPPQSFMYVGAEACEKQARLL